MRSATDSGRKGALEWDLGLFGAGALFAGVSTSTGQVIVARAVMGVAAGFVMPAILSIITTVFPPPTRGRPGRPIDRPDGQGRRGH